MKKAALYTRVSTNHQVDKDSLPFQKQELINYSRYVLGIEDYEIFQDAGYSGKNTDRPKYKEMINRIKKGEFSHLLVWKIDRISRNLIDFCKMYEELKDHNCAFISKNENFDTSTAMGEAMLKITLVFAELERNVDSERVTSIMLDRASKGLWNGANCPLGYKWNNETKFPDIDEEEAMTIQFIYDKYEELNSSLQVSKLLNNNNLKTKRGGKWSSKTVSDIIRNPFYKGTYRYNYRESARGKKKDESEWIIIEDNHSPIISKEQWERCNKIMNTNAQRNTALFRKNSNIHFFAGMIKCKVCNETYIANSDTIRKDGYRPSYYYCKGKYNNTGCAAKTISDIVVGPFVMNYLANLLNAQKNLTKKDNLNDLEKMILSGKTFNDVYGINKLDLENLYTALLYSRSENILLRAPKEKKKINKTDLTLLNKQKEKYLRALDRLQDLYLFDDDAMSEKDYLIKKLEINEKLDKVNDELKKLQENDLTNVTFNDVEFLKKTSNFMINNELIHKRSINFKSMAMTIDKNIIKDFINTVIEKIEVKDGRVYAIHFKNGLVNNFIYKERES